VAAKHGVEAIPNWHDPLGFAALAICLLLVWGLARLISGPLPKLLPSKTRVLTPFPWRLATGLGACVLFTVLGAEIWYRVHETKDNLRWSVIWPVAKKDFRDVTIPKSDADALSFDEGRGAAWANDDGSRWTAFFFKWAEGPTRSRILARMHRPENCLPAAGYKLREDRGTITVKANNLLIPFHALDFEYAEDQAYVFFCLWEDRSKQSDRPRIRDEWTRFAKLESVLLGERNLGQQVLEIVILGYATHQEAEVALRREMEGLVRSAPVQIPETNSPKPAAQRNSSSLHRSQILRDL
jgi:hypothetical protein